MSDTLNSAICHGILAASSGWALSQCLDYKFASIGFGLYLVNGVLGVLSYGIAWDNLKLYKVYSGFWRWSLTVILPLIATQLYVNHGFGHYIALLHFFFPFVYMVTSQLVKRSKLPFLELFHLGSLLSILYISFVNNQYYGISMAVSYVISFYVVGSTGMIQNTPSKDLFNISVIFSNYFTVRALKGQ